MCLVSDDKERVSDHDEGDKQQKDVKNPTQGEEISGIIVDKAKNDYTVLVSIYSLSDVRSYFLRERRRKNYFVAATKSILRRGWGTKIKELLHPY